LGSEWRGVFWYLDHGAIWLCIASTITCVHVIACKPRRAYLIAVWVAALGGACLELIWLSRLPPWVSPLAYVAMGWLGTFPLLELWRRHGKGAAAPILSGGVIYTLGGAADALEWPNFGPNLGSHETLHVMVLGGTAFFWLVVHQAMLREAEVLQEEG